MKPRTFLYAGLISLAVVVPVFGQKESVERGAPKPKKSDLALRAEARIQELALPPAATASLAEAEDGPVATDSPEWRLEQAQKLLRTGLWLKKKGEPEVAAEAATKALALLDGAAGMIDRTKQPALAAKLDELAGLVHERLTGDAVQARQRYEKAKQVAADAAPLADSRLKRLDRAEGRPEKPTDKGSLQDNKLETPKN